MATRCSASSTSSRRSGSEPRRAPRCSARRGSMVPPLFDEMTNNVVSGFASARMARTRTGESESKRLERPCGRVRLVVLRDGHGRLGGAALPDKHDGLQSLSDDGVGERLGSRAADTAGCWQDQSIPCTARRMPALRSANPYRLASFACRPTGHAFLHERLRGRIELFQVTATSCNLLSAGNSRSF